MHFSRSLAGVALLGVFAAMAFAGAATGAPAQSQLTTPIPGSLSGKKLNIKKVGLGTMASGRQFAVQKDPYKAVLVDMKKSALLATGTSRIVPNAKQGALSYKAAPSALNAAAAASADQPIAHVGSNVLARTGVNAYQQEVFGGYTVEPPDPTVCAGQGFVVQLVNSQVQISDGNLNKLTAPISMESFFGDFINVLTDPLCSYNHSTGKWYMTEGVNDLLLGGTFSGVYIAVSTTSDPRSPWNIYFLDLTLFGGLGGCAASSSGCLADQPNLGSDQYTIQISTNQFDLAADGCLSGFCGATYILMDKVAMALGNPVPNVFAFDIGPAPTILPDFNFGDCVDGFGPCWYSIQPADAANGRYDTRSGGTGWAMSALDFFGLSDSRIALWRFSNTSSIGAFIPNIIGTAAILHMNGHDIYSDPRLAAQPQNPTSPIQANGNPLGDFLVLAGFCAPGTPPAGCSNPGPIDAGDDRMRDTMLTTLSTGQRIMWGGLGDGSAARDGILLFGVNLGSTAASSSLQRYWRIHNPDTDLTFPAVAIGDTGQALVSYGVSGSAMYPSAAYSLFSTSQAPASINIANQGRGVQDGFTQYATVFTLFDYRPRWGDYSGAATMGNSIYFTTEFIPAANCSLFVFKDVDDTCGGTRTFFANWGTSLDRIALSH